MEKENKLKSFMRSPVGREIVRFLGLAAVIIIFAIWTKGRNLTAANIKGVWKQTVFILIGGVGAVFVMAQGALNFSIGGVAACCALVFGAVGAKSPLLAFPVALLLGIGFELLLAYTHLLLNIPPFMVSFAIMFLSKGILSSVTQKAQIALPRTFKPLNTSATYYLVTAAVVIVGLILFEFTRIGKYNKAIGSNRATAEASGVNTRKYTVLAFLICGICCGICGSVNIIRGGGVSGMTCAALETDILIAMVLGGIPLSGGTSVRMTGIIAGAFTLSFLENGLVVAGLSSDVMGLIKGIVFLVAVAVSYSRRPGEIVL